MPQEGREGGTGQGYRRPLRLFAVGVLLLSALVGCGLLGDQGSGGSENPKSLERASIKVGILPTIDIAPLRLALDKGYFAAEGLDVQLVTAASGQAALAAMASDDVQLALSSYVPFLVAQSSGTVDLRIVTDCSAATKGGVQLMVAKDSAVRDPAGLVGKRIAVTARSTISDTLVMSALKTRGIDYRTIQWVEMPFPDMASRLAAGDVDAALMAEPFVVKAEKSVGAVRLLDVASGPTEGIALTGYGATADFVANNPKTVAAFQRAMRRAVDEARDRSRIEPLLRDIAKIDAATAAQISLYTYRAVPDPARLQRVADLLLEFGVLKKPLDVSGMIAAQPGG